MIHLSDKKCVACEGGTPPLSKSVIETYRAQLKTPWVVLDDNPEGSQSNHGAGKISQEFKFKDFEEALAFVNKVAEIAKSEGHHPDLHIFYNKVKIELWTHAVQGLSENDFILAAKIEKLL
ncbi:MAG: 4a-hydroxytetrahydrobiopterin dehydratase [bacterium]|nr:4a-hydroxytetrahydrobiopterin dehydratase [bacterium]